MRTYLRLPLVLALAAAACTDPNDLEPASTPNRVDTVELYSITGTAFNLPSAFTVGPTRPYAVRADREEELFDFIFNIDTTGGGATPLFLPLRALGLDLSGADAGLQRSEEPFEQLEDPPSTGYVTDSAVTAEVGVTYAVRSRLTICGSVPLYAKLRVLGISDSSVTLEVLANQNCGYRALNVGLPER